MLNPAKLTPPCLREQIQAMLKVFRAVVDKVVREKNAAAKTISEGGVPRPGGIVRQLRAPEPEVEVPIRKSPVSRRSVVVKGPAPAPNLLPPTPATASASSKKKPLEVTSDTGRQKLATVEGSASLLKQRDFKEGLLIKMKDELERAEIALAMRESRRQELQRLEQTKWDEFAGIQHSKQAMTSMDDAAKKVIDARLRSLMEDAVAVSTNLATLNPEIKHWTEAAANLRSQLLQLQESIKILEAKIDVLIVQESCIRPQHLYTAFPVNLGEVVPLKTHLPCVGCGRYWADMALANLPCGCLLHPICLFQVALNASPCCPGCNAKPCAGWMGQWGFKSDFATARTAAAAVKREGWAPPLSRSEAKTQFTKRKTTDEPSPLISSPKRACLPALLENGPDDEVLEHMSVEPAFPPRVDAPGVTTKAPSCEEVTVHKNKVVEVGSGATTATTCGKPREAAASDTLKKLVSKVDDAGHDTASSRCSPLVDAKLELIVGTPPGTVDPAELRDIVNIACAAAAEAKFPTTPT